ncbi:family 20 glycosylhydrolase [uncultured Tessaracoccus sp.]|uniref:family 20 glycosylhydrolase n=1 Tax=uncultured Tessaracoccus sp. TaxID=905023 RepID=UPI0025E2CDCB|nr:family 20 glycosylhydrolase [uncultured Tessaracoccus sp.]
MTGTNGGGYEAVATPTLIEELVVTMSMRRSLPRRGAVTPRAAARATRARTSALAKLGATLAAAALCLTAVPSAAEPPAPAPAAGPSSGGLANPTSGLRDVVPRLQQLRVDDDGTPWLPTDGSRVLVVGDDAVALRDARAFASTVARASGATVTAQRGAAADAQAGDVVVELGDVEGLPGAGTDEGYGITVAAGVARVAAPTATGLFHAEQTLIQSVRTAGGAQAATVVDWPAHPDRSLHVDAARKYFSPAWFKAQIDRLAEYKVNQVQWHVSENEGFRLESKRHPEIMSEQYITQEQAKGIVAHAKARHIQIVPSLDVPGHMGQVIAKKPEFAAADTDEGRKMLDYSKPEVRAFVKDLVSEFAPIFDTDTWHIGGDEVFDMNTLGTLGTRYPQLLAYAKDVTGEPDAEVLDGYMHFLDEVATNVKGLGVEHVRVWSDLLSISKHVTLPKDIEVAYWTKWHTSMPSAKTLVDEGHKLLNVHDGYFYYVLPRCSTCAYHERVPASTILAEWTPTKFSGNSEPVAASSVTGASYAIWADKPDVETEQQVADGIRLPVTAMVERTWNPNVQPDFDHARWETVVNVLDGKADATELLPPSTDPTTRPALVPLPAEMQMGEGTFALTADTRIVAPAEARSVANLLRDRVATATGYPLPVVDRAQREGDIQLRLDPSFTPTDTPVPDEGYRLSVTPDGVQVIARTPQGLFYGTQTLVQLFPPLIESDTLVLGDWSAPAVEIVDAPRFAHRSAQNDVARSFLTVDEVKHIVDTMATVKQNRLHLHLADDQGWRIEITNEGKAADDPVDYTKLTEVSGKSAMLLDKRHTHERELGRHGYYTQDEYREIVRYAAERFVQVIPEIDVPAHSNAILHAIPELNSAKSLPAATVYGTVPEQNDGDVGESALDLDNPQTWVSLRHIFTQIAEMTPGNILHVGGDESHAMMVNHPADYAKFVTRTVDLAHALGKHSMGWNEYAVADLQPGDVVHYWVGDTAVTKQAIRDKGARVVISKADSSYLDMKYDASTPIGLTWAGMGDLDKYYDWDPATVVAGIDESSILGVEAPIWAETIRGGDQKEFLMFPRVISHAEIGWTPQSERDLPDFLERMQSMGSRLQARGMNFYDGPRVAWSSELGGTPTTAGTDRTRIEVARLAAPRTVISADGGSVLPATKAAAVRSAASAPSTSEAITATIDFGDGSAPVPATFTTDRARDAVHAAGIAFIGADHAYAQPGTHDVTVTLSDGRVARSTVTVEDGWTAPSAPTYDACSIPTMHVADGAVRDDSRVIVDATGMEPNAFVDVRWDGTSQGTVRSDDRGSLEASVYVPYRTPRGDHLLRLQSPDGRFVEQVVTVDSRTNPPKGAVIEGVTARTSSEATNESAPNGLATAIVDGDPATFWHSQWAQPAATYPHWVELDLGRSHDLTSLTWVPRQDSANGLVATVTVSVSDDGATWTPVREDATLEPGQGPTTLDLAATARHVRIDLLDPQKANQVWATVGEITLRGTEEGKAPEEPAPVVAEEWQPAEGCPTPGPEPSPDPTPSPSPEPTPTPGTPAPTPERSPTPGTPAPTPGAPAPTPDRPTPDAPGPRPRTSAPIGGPTSGTPTADRPSRPHPGLPATGW